MLMALGLWVACQDVAPIGNGTGTGNGLCLDLDGDGYGVNCPAGLDCNDADETIHADCAVDDPCLQPRYGCPCESEGEELECQTSRPVVSPDGASLCYKGTRTCLAGEWGVCEGMTAFLPNGQSSSSGAGDGVSRQALLGDPEVCPDSCEGGCTRVYDCPSGADIDPVADEVRYDINNMACVADTDGDGVCDDVGAAGSADDMERHVGLVLRSGLITGSYSREYEAECTEDGKVPIWWSLTFDAGPAQPPTDQEIVFEVRAAMTQADLASATWVTVVSCPDGSATSWCTTPTSAQSRSNPADGNLQDALGREAMLLPWLELQVTFKRGDAADDSPWLQSVEAVFFCDEGV
jgi:hypothetical protein